MRSASHLLKHQRKLQLLTNTKRFLMHNLENQVQPGNLKGNIVALIRAYQSAGHHEANLDPLGINDTDLNSTPIQELKLERYQFSEADMDTEVHLGLPMLKGFLDPDRPTTTLRKLLTRLKETYCESIGVEYMHIGDRNICNWIRERVETPQKYSFSKEEKLVILERLISADLFERFLAQKFNQTKRFGVEGGESLIPGMKSMIDEICDLGVESVVIGMPHRGRLNVLGNVCHKPMELIFTEFAQTNFATGDVKYHLGYATTKKTINGKDVHLSLVPNPSHLEAVNPVVEGKTRAKQYILKDEKRDKVVSVLLHGDAAFAGQGVVYETLGLTDLHGYTTGGTIHVIVNNQIGFTTNPVQSRSTSYCSDIAKMISTPIFHVNGDDVEAVVHVFKLAAQYRQQFHKDVVVDLICYRKHGHNEVDQPMFTQPKMYTEISKRKSTLDFYVEQLINEGVVTKEVVTQMQDKIRAQYNEAYANSKKDERWDSSAFSTENWFLKRDPSQFMPDRPTGISEEVFQTVGNALCTVPEDFNLHASLRKELAAKREMIKTGQRIDWGTGEALAFGSLLHEGYHVRLSGQDCERGTFSHRHSVLIDQKTEQRYVPLNNISPNQSEYAVFNSHLSEYAVLGFEYGYSIESPKFLNLWEAQFGDFANGAQIMIDQFISSAEQKWLRSSGLVMLLPHGYEGQGPEHSNARLERYLQLTNEEPDYYPADMQKHNYHCAWQVVNCSTPANYFHALRRQVHRDFRKPLVVMTPKSLLRYKFAVSSFDDIKTGTAFQRVIPDAELTAPTDKVRRVVFCTGKVYYDLRNYRIEKQIQDVAIVRVEQLTPFPFDLVGQTMQQYSKAEAVWVQEEPENYGAWLHFYFRAVTAFRQHGRTNLVPRYVGRKSSASPATGNHHVHEVEQKELVAAAFQ
jgi:2-oxoglutarate dehydrogenase E1 component